MKNDSDLDIKRKRDFDDLQDEYAGRETGRMRRFLTQEPQTPEERQKQRTERAMRSLLRILLNDPIYRTKYEKATALITEATLAVEAALSALADQIAAAQAETAGMEARAARLPDGTRVYRDAKGVIRRPDGSVVEETLAATILWTGNEPSYEAYTAATDLLDQLEEQQSEATTYLDDVLAPAQDQMNDPSNPPSLEDLDTILESLTGKMPEIVQQQQAAPDEDLGAQPDSSQINVPKIQG